MNGYYKTHSTKEKLENLAAQIPQELRADAFAQSMPEDGNPAELVRKLTGYVIWSLPAAIEQKRQADESAQIVEWLEENDNDYLDLKRTEQDALGR